MKISFNTPINRVSFGQVSIALLREALKQKHEVFSLPISEPDFSSLESPNQDNSEFLKWVNRSVEQFPTCHTKDTPVFKLWHLEKNLGFFSLSNNQSLMTFHELDNLTPLEVNIAKNNRKVIVTSKYTQEVFESKGVKAHYVPLGFDKQSFRVIDKPYHTDGRIVFNLSGKFEFRKRHAKVLKAWAKKFGNDKRYALQCAMFNPFMTDADNNNLISDALDNQRYFNITFLPMMQTNETYNDYLNSASIIIGMSGGEGWGLPEFQSVALGKHAVIMNAHGYKGWANSENSTLVDSTSMIDCVDNIFFKKGAEQNQGKIFDFDESDFISACEEAIKKVEVNPVNESGLKLAEDFSYENSYNKIVDVLNE
tara:strand:+ start:229 stop:1329 length:1101 start_codon:yes stop_codon:yes gene_type:complete